MSNRLSYVARFVWKNFLNATLLEQTLCSDNRTLFCEIGKIQELTVHQFNLLVSSVHCYLSILINILANEKQTPEYKFTFNDNID